MKGFDSYNLYKKVKKLLSTLKGKAFISKDEALMIADYYNKAYNKNEGIGRIPQLYKYLKLWYDQKRERYLPKQDSKEYEK